MALSVCLKFTDTHSEMVSVHRVHQDVVSIFCSIGGLSHMHTHTPATQNDKHFVRDRKIQCQGISCLKKDLCI